MAEPTPDPQSMFKKVIGGRLLFLQQHPLLADWLLIAPFLIIGVVSILVDQHPTDPLQRAFDPLGVVLVLVIVVPVAWRRRAPRLTLAINILAMVPFLVLNYSDNGIGIASLFALYTVAAHCERRDASVALAWTAAVVVPVLVAGVLYSGEQLPVGVVISNVVIFGTAWLIGDSVRNRRILVDELRFRAETAERQKAAEAQKAVLDERARIAREMHDIVAHGMSVMTVQAAAARRVLAKHPEQAAEALANIEETGRQAMIEMRLLLGVLRDDDVEAAGTDTESLTHSSAATAAPTNPGGAGPCGDRSEPVSFSPQPGLSSVPALVEQWNEAGLHVTYEILGETPHLSPSLDVSVYRLIQEALTNTSKHAGSAQANVTVQATGGDLDIRITDDGRGAAAAAVAGTGHGIIGMHERVNLFGGTLTAAPGRGGGFDVHVVLPLDASGHPPTVGATRP